MKEYFLVENNVQKGPFSINEMKELNITRHTLVWKTGLENWVTADKIEELTELIKDTPPLVPTDLKILEPDLKKLKKEKVQIQLAKKIKFVFFYLIGSIAFSVFMYYFLYYIVFNVPKLEEGWYNWRWDSGDIPDWIEDIFNSPYDVTNTIDDISLILFYSLLALLILVPIVKWIKEKSSKEL
jgi:hypothetical protein